MTKLKKREKKEYIKSQDDMDMEKWSSLSDHERALFIDEYIAMIVVDLDINIVVTIKLK